MPCISIKNLIVDYEKRAIDNINLDINPGEFVCIIGANGSGKSTLAKTINGLVIPTSGSVSVYGMDTKDEKNIIDIRKKVGMTFQNPDNQIVASIVEEDIAFGLENLGIPSEEIRLRIDNAMKSLDIYNLKDLLVNKLSGGQKQKVSIAGILAMKSDIIILDEPTSMIDKEGRCEVLDTLTKLNKEGKTIILISHYVEEIKYASRVLVMKSGKIMLDDTYKNILLKPDELYAANIELPYISKLATELKKMGKNLKGNEIEVVELCRSLV